MALVVGQAGLIEAHCRQGLSRYTHVKAEQRGPSLLDARAERRSNLVSHGALKGSTAPNMVQCVSRPNRQKLIGLED
jgi:hypothetical protein